MYITSQTLNSQNMMDKIGVGASLLCVLHCLITPLLVTTLPVVAATEEQMHSVFAIIILSLGMLAFIPGYQKHENKLILITGFMGVSLIIIAALLPEMENAEILETGLVVVGGITLSIAHLRNAYWCRLCNNCNNNCCDFTKK